MVVGLTLFAQIRISSPYSRYGLGNLSDNSNAWNFSMGQTGIGMRSPYHINYLNPASYIAFDSTSFLFEGGFQAQFVTLSSNFQKTNRNYASLGYLLFGMPVTKWWRSSIGLVPYSDVGYSVLNYEEYENTGTVLRLYQGSGGINRLYWGNALRIVKGLSVGFNMSYLFGSMIREASVYFPDSIYAMNFKVLNYVTVNSLYLNFGLQYRMRLKNNLFLNLGAIFSNTTSMSAKTDMLAYTFLLSNNGVEYPKDTLVKERGYSGKIVIPMVIGGGFSLERPDKWTVGVDYRWQNWSQFSAFGLSDSLVDAWMVSAGGEITPNIDNYANYLARVRYRLGFNYENTYLQLRGKNLTAYSVSLGLGLPLRGVKTLLNLGVSAGMRGTTEQNLIKESYIKLVIGFTIYERWFVKRKYF
jgi:hypothetical protein